MNLPRDLTDKAHEIIDELMTARHGVTIMLRVYRAHEKDESQLNALVSYINAAIQTTQSLNWPTTRISNDWTPQPPPKADPAP
jgi:hypothetical protein